MKRMKKLMSIMLALVMVLAMSITIFAAGNGSITIDNPVTGATYSAYKIFDVVYNTNDDGSAGDKYSYTIEGNSPWFSTVATVENGSVTSGVTGLTFTKAADKNVYVVTEGEGFSAANFANQLKNALTGKTGTDLTLDSDTKKMKAENLDLGYYLVVGTVKNSEGQDVTEALANLTTTNPSVTIHDKNDNPFEKTDDKVSADVGETVTYTITGKVPDTTGFAKYTYKFHDTMSDGLTFNKDVVVKIGSTVIYDGKTEGSQVGTNVTDNQKATVEYDVALEERAAADPNSFTVSVPVKEWQDHIGETITVTYTAKVNENAIAKIENNKAKLEYTNNPNGNTTFTPKDIEKVYTSKIVIDKWTDSNNTKGKQDDDTRLAGAEFVLYKEVITGEGESAVTTRYYYKYTASKAAEDDSPAVEAKVEWVTNIDEATKVTTNANGAASFGGLANGTYYLLETKAPDGYNLLAEPKQVTVNGNSKEEGNVVEADLTVTEAVENNAGSKLPETGGIGTTIFYVLGAILFVGAGVLLVVKKRMSAEK